MLKCRSCDLTSAASTTQRGLTVLVRGMAEKEHDGGVPCLPPDLRCAAILSTKKTKTKTKSKTKNKNNKKTPQLLGFILVLFVSYRPNSILLTFLRCYIQSPTGWISLISNLVCFNGGKCLILPDMTVTSSSWLLARERWLL